MLLTLSTTFSPATDLGFLLEKHPARVHGFRLTAGQATVFYTAATDHCCTVALVVEIDPVGLVRGRSSAGRDPSLDQYVNDRPYAASSMLSVALGAAFRSAMAGKSRHRPELVDAALPFVAKIPVLPSRGGDAVVRRLFEPLGYEVDVDNIALDPTFPEWGASRYRTVTLTHTCKLKDLLRHLYVLIPVLDDRKHYWVGGDEVEKLLRHASEWLPDHPEKELIAERYLKHRAGLARQALARLVAEEDVDSEDRPTVIQEDKEQALEQRVSLYQHRINAVTRTIESSGAKTLVDLGCGDGRFLAALLKIKQLTKLVGTDVSLRALETAANRLKLDRLAPRQRARIDLIHGSLIYKDKRLQGFDVATVIEVIEHLDPGRLVAFERVLFEVVAAPLIIVTTPNREYNVRFESLPAGEFRHPDHRFEWTRQEFRAWCDRFAEKYGYRVTIEGVGDHDAELGTPTQMALFSGDEPAGDAAVGTDSGD